MKNYTYTIIPISQITTSIIDVCVGDGENLRKSIDENYAVIEWETSIGEPEFVSQLGLVPRSQSEMIVFLEKPENGFVI